MVTAGDDPFLECERLALAGPDAFGQLVHEHRGLAGSGCMGALAAGHRGDGWPANSGGLVLQTALQLMTGAGAVLQDAGLLLGARRGVLSLDPLARLVLEHAGMAWWILTPGTELTDSASVEDLKAAVRVSMARTAVFRISTAHHFNRGMKPSEKRTERIDTIADAYGAMLYQAPKGPHGEPGKWYVCREREPALATVVEKLERLVFGKRPKDRPPLYDAFCVGSHPNVHWLEAMSGSTRYERPIEEILPTFRVAALTFGYVWDVVRHYAGWDGSAADAWIREVEQLQHADPDNGS